MKVTLVAYTRLTNEGMHLACVNEVPIYDTEALPELAGRVCYRGLDKMGTDPDFVTKRIEQGHLSLLRHVNFTFLVEGISRSCSHQIVRHQAGCSYSQESQRYCETTCDSVVMPRSILDNDDAFAAFDLGIGDIHNAYLALLKEGIPKEDARCILPNATKTRILITMNGQALRHFITIRGLNPAAQREIREVALEMLFVAHKVAPKLFDDLTKG